jgi:hypothetical protein
MPKRKRAQGGGDSPRGRPRQKVESNAAETNLQRRIQEAELHRHLLIETLHAVSASISQSAVSLTGVSANETDLPPGPWHKGGGPGGDGGGLPPNAGHRGGAAGRPLLASNLEERLSEVELHRHLLISALHGVVEQTRSNQSAVTEGN